MGDVDKKLLGVKSNLTEAILNKWKFCYAVVLPGKFQSLFIQTLKFFVINNTNCFRRVFERFIIINCVIIIIIRRTEVVSSSGVL